MTNWRDDLKIESAGKADRDDQRNSGICTKDMHFSQFLWEWTQAVASDKGTVFMTFREQSPVLGSYVITHAYDLWADNSDLWDTVAAFARNYVKRVERDYKQSPSLNLDNWRRHGELIRDLITGSTS